MVIVVKMKTESVIIRKKTGLSPNVQRAKCGKLYFEKNVLAEFSTSPNLATNYKAVRVHLM